MDIRISNYHIYSTLQSAEELTNKTPVLFLHGFTGSSADWLNIFPMIDSRFYPFGIDLIGHGKSASPDNIELYTQSSVVTQIESALEYYKIDKVILCGYSMGARAALSFYYVFPGRVAGLILESVNPGLTNESDRNERIKSDSRLADMIENEGVTKFIDYWYNLPLFGSLKLLPDKLFGELITSRYSNNSLGLINSLTGFGTGRMESYWNRLCEIGIPLQLIAGEMDEKYVNITNRIHHEVKNSHRDIINSAGHNTHLEKPAEFVSLINTFLKSYF